jgi:hypothetical protein
LRVTRLSAICHLFVSPLIPLIAVCVNRCFLPFGSRQSSVATVGHTPPLLEWREGQGESQMHVLGVNAFAVIVAALAAMVIGFLWYSPLLFARPWCVAMGYNPDDKVAMDAMRKKTGPLYLLAMAAALLAALGLGNLIWGHMNAQSSWIGLHAGIFVWLAFVATVQLTDTAFGGKPMKLFFINTGYQLVSYAVMGAILGAWR